MIGQDYIKADGLPHELLLFTVVEDGEMFTDRKQREKSNNSKLWQVSAGKNDIMFTFHAWFVGETTGHARSGYSLKYFTSRFKGWVYWDYLIFCENLNHLSWKSLLRRNLNVFIFI